MLNNKPFTTDNQEILRLMGELVLNGEQMRGVIETISDSLTLERIIELMEEISAEALEEIQPEDNVSEFDMILWKFRQAYIYGFSNAITIMNTTIRKSIIESAIKNNLISPLETDEPEQAVTE